MKKKRKYVGQVKPNKAAASGNSQANAEERSIIMGPSPTRYSKNCNN